MDNNQKAKSDLLRSIKKAHDQWQAAVAKAEELEETFAIILVNIAGSANAPTQAEIAKEVGRSQPTIHRLMQRGAAADRPTRR